MFVFFITTATTTMLGQSYRQMIARSSLGFSIALHDRSIGLGDWSLKRCAGMLRLPWLVADRPTRRLIRRCGG